MRLLAHALLAAAFASPVRTSPPCDDGRAVEAVRTELSRERFDVSTLQLVVEGPYDRAKFVRTHPTFPASAAVKQRLAGRRFWFVWFHPPFRGSAGARGTDVWGLVDSGRCELLHLARGR